MQLGEGYNIELKLDYSGSLNLRTEAETKQLSGTSNLIIEHSRGEEKCGSDVDCVLIKVA